MADYHSILKKTIESLPENTGAARRSVYSRARNAIVNQLKSYEPPLSPSEITAEQLRLEEAIRKVEAEAARATLGLGPRPTAASSPRPGDKPEASPVRSEPADAVGPGEPKVAATVAPVEKSAAPAVDRSAEKAPVEPSFAGKDKPGSSLEERSEPRFSDAEKPLSGGGFSSSAVPKSEAKEPYSAPPHVSLGSEPRFRDSEGETAEDDRDPASVSASGAAGWAKAGSAQGGGTGDKAAKAPKRSRKSRSGTRMSDRLRSDDGKSTGGSLGLVVLLILIVIGLGGVLYSQKDLFSELFSGSDGGVQDQVATATPDLDPSGAETSEPAVLPPVGEPSETPDDTGKIEDRLLDDNGQLAVAEDARSVTTQPIRPGDGISIARSMPVPGADAGGEPSAEGADLALATPEAPVEASPVDDAVAASVLPNDVQEGTQRAILYEEGDENNGAGTASQGEVTWALETDTDLEGRSQKVLTASVTIPERNVTVTMRIKPNDDTSLPASHLVELKYNLPDDFPAGDVVNVPGLVMKPTEEARGDALIGASVKVSAGYFWIALSSIDSERDRNLALLRERAWIDIPILYENGRRGILTLEKGSAGTAAVNQAITAWVTQ